MKKHISAQSIIGRDQCGESTKPIRAPVSIVEDIKPLIDNESSEYQLPLYGSTVKAGFPSPADDYIETNLDLNSHLIKHPAATFFVRASGDSMIQAGIHSGDILIVDRSIEACHNKIVIAAIDGELTVKRLLKTNHQVKLLAENPEFEPIDITREQDLVIWGVVTHVIHSV